MTTTATNYATLSDAIALAAVAHQKQLDKSGKPYILHPLTIMMRLVERTRDEYTLMVAVLHDTIEDTFVTIDYLVENNYPPEVIDDLKLMTKNKGEDYEDDYIRRIGTSYRATVVKMEDLHHNSDITRLKGVSEDDLKRMAKYHRSYLYLTERKRFLEQTIINNTMRV